eukprot:CAMPEP_0117736222 /NCGR_PEP_ID=MMETSP0947-20121206/1797_1 /TAXON_ID=44440 /ORGANISM="Chattonella subsalsa, Strain CCMP2191" /LENGTH=211 /DNA_ID=CAMNT_0005551463 /DNA_START=140 /DNA_END=775 /DNA_ORIENTATION=+
MKCKSWSAVKKVFTSLFGDIEVKDLSLLDIGTGSGGAILPFKPFFKEIVCTDSSIFCVRQARRKGLNCIHSDNLSSSQECSKEFDMIALQNVLDRCSHPISLLNEAKQRLRKQPRGLILVALAFPFNPFVAVSPLSFLRKEEETGKPSENLPISGDCWETQVNSAVEVFEKQGMELKYLTRVPYLCQAVQGDPNDFYHLDNAILVLRAKEE